MNRVSFDGWISPITSHSTFRIPLTTCYFPIELSEFVSMKDSLYLRPSPETLKPYTVGIDVFLNKRWPQEQNCFLGILQMKVAVINKRWYVFDIVVLLEVLLSNYWLYKVNKCNTLFYRLRTSPTSLATNCFFFPKDKETSNSGPFVLSAREWMYFRQLVTWMVYTLLRIQHSSSLPTVPFLPSTINPWYSFIFLLPLSFILTPMVLTSSVVL